MSIPIQAVRGMHDVLPEHAPYWRHVEECFCGLARAYGYEEIRFPLVEKTELFERSIGAVTDIVEKEMYSFTDRNGDSLTLRPEGTAGCVRACIENGLIHNQIQRLWYAGPMFRHERPQKGRYRQFFQLGAEAYGMPGPDVDAELILMSARLWRMLGIEGLELQINSLGSAQARAAYHGELTAYLAAHEAQLDEDSRRRLHSNPLRVLDSKNPELGAVIDGAPKITERLDAASANHFAGLCAALDEAGVAYRVNPRLVRGLDYYQRTVFEWVSGRLGAQGTVCAGGRYDELIEQLGGGPTPAAGFALGIERVLALLMEGGAAPAGERPQVYLIAVGEAAERQGLALAERLREALPGLRLRVNCGGGSFKSQFKRADRSGAAFALVLGADEVAGGRIGIKYLREDRPQETVAQSALAGRLQAIVRGSDEA